MAASTLPLYHEPQRRRRVAVLTAPDWASSVLPDGEGPALRVAGPCRAGVPPERTEASAMGPPQIEALPSPG